MIIPIELSPPPHRLPKCFQPALAKLGSNEVVLIELQGWLDVVEGERPDGLIGSLCMENDKPVLKIGHHLLEGKMISLSKPLAVLAKVGEIDDIHEGEAVSMSYDVLTIVKRKVTFSKRPVPVIPRAC
ncbi:hypothetical protein K439DRAFT_1417880 [Ramaria rubella]|nr:hypothetical protein K439DRAFT_1417880 [Ramaria rubella]